MNFIYKALLSLVFLGTNLLTGSEQIEKPGAEQAKKSCEINRSLSEFSIESLLNPDARLASGFIPPSSGLITPRSGLITPNNSENPNPPQVVQNRHSDETAGHTIRAIFAQIGRNASSSGPHTPAGSICHSSTTESSSSGSSPSPESEPTPAHPFSLQAQNRVSLAAVAASVGATYSKFGDEPERADDLLNKGYKEDPSRLETDLLSIGNLIEQRNHKRLNEILVRLKCALEYEIFEDSIDRINNGIKTIEIYLTSQNYSHGAPSAPKRRCAVSRIGDASSSGASAC